MTKIRHHQTIKEKRKIRVRKRITGTSLRPRLTVYRSNQHLCLQVIDDSVAKTLAAVSDLTIKKNKEQNKTARSKEVAKQLITFLKKKKIKALVFDRGYYRYHGRVKAVADTLREGGIEV